MKREQFESKTATLLNSLQEEIFLQIYPSTKVLPGPNDLKELHKSLATLIGETLFLHQKDISEIAYHFRPGNFHGIRTPLELLEMGRIGDDTVLERFRNGQFLTTEDTTATAKLAVEKSVLAIASAIHRATWFQPGEAR